MTRPVVVLGGSGSIGRQTLDVCAELDLQVAAIAVRNPSPFVLEMADRYPTALLAVAGGSKSERDELKSVLGDRVRFGTDEVEALATLPGCVVVNAIVGAAGLKASVAALTANNRLALANKESLVAAGEIVLAARDAGSGELVPIDSEHSALFQCLTGEPIDSVARVILTASGGPFRGYNLERLSEVTVEQALQHPTWKMGGRITVDSATLFNKGMEVIEAHHLFGLDYDRIEVVIHPQSIIHSLVEFTDLSMKAQLSVPDMRLPIQFALTYPERLPRSQPVTQVSELNLTFEYVDREAFPALDLAYQAGRQGGSAPAIANAADEIAVAAFLGGRLGFLGISQVIEKTLDQIDVSPLRTLDDVIAVDTEARFVANSLVSGWC